MTNEAHGINRVSIPKEVAAAIVERRNVCFWENADIIDLTNYLKQDRSTKYSTGPCNVIGKFIIADWNINYPLFVNAVINGYQVEATPEEKVREYYEDSVRHSELAEPSSIGKALYNGRKHAIKETLYLLGIKIEGVNA